MGLWCGIIIGVVSTAVVELIAFLLIVWTLDRAQEDPYDSYDDVP